MHSFPSEHRLDDFSHYTCHTPRSPGAKSVEGEAQIVMARGKKRFIYDFNVVLDIEIVVETVNLSPGIDDISKGLSMALLFTHIHSLLST